MYLLLKVQLYPQCTQCHASNIEFCISDDIFSPAINQSMSQTINQSIKCVKCVCKQITKRIMGYINCDVDASMTEDMYK